MRKLVHNKRDKKNFKKNYTLLKIQKIQSLKGSLQL